MLPFLNWKISTFPLEALLTLLVIIGLAVLARPLAEPEALRGLNGRYTTASQYQGNEVLRQRAQQIQKQAGRNIAWLATTGWLVLWLVRRRMAPLALASLASAAWLNCAAQVQAFGWE